MCQGSRHWPLGKLAATAGDPEAADRHFAEAERRNQEIGMARVAAQAEALRAKLGG